MEREARQYLEWLSGALAERGVPSRSLVRRGDAAVEILAVAQEETVGLIAMCDHSRSPAERWSFGSVTERVRHHAEVPVLVTHPVEDRHPDWSNLEEESYQRILLPQDGPAVVDEAVSCANEIAGLSGGQVSHLGYHTGAPAESILRTSLRLRTDLIVMTMQGGTGAKRLRQWEVVDQVIRGGSSAILLIPRTGCGEGERRTGRQDQENPASPGGIRTP
jgi:nucleotide-binding universal stress UspA family protein